MFIEYIPISQRVSRHTSPVENFNSMHQREMHLSQQNFTSINVFSIGGLGVAFIAYV